MTFSANDTIFVAGVRKNLYFWTVPKGELLRSIDAHFGRILNLCSVTINSADLLISSSLDHSVKVWNMENIFEKAFSIPVMDQSIEKINIPENSESVVIVQTRKYLGLWDIRSHKFVKSLSASSHAAIITDSLASSDGMKVLSIESDNLLLWDLRTQSVVQQMNAPNVHQILFLNQERMIVDQ
ncbi:hypothetical protein AB6A40_009124 [Gnathostoma spinigerum]|uniref:NWD2 C-terminal beta-propeller domain-containing protein n=1 Tax=Gnathostoma spinigerum TaxID=75299 RepID=A0ABD6ER18_9BILA